MKYLTVSACVFIAVFELPVVASVEAPLALFEKPVKVVLLDAVKFAHVAHERQKILGYPL